MPSVERVMEDRKWWQIPAFGDWDYSDEMSFTQYFKSARRVGLDRGSIFAAGCEEDLFKVAIEVPVKSAYQYGHCNRKVRGGKATGEEEKPYSSEQKQRKQGSVSGDIKAPPRRPKAAPKAVDEDLYKIPPELLYQKPKRKRLPRNLFSGCLGLN